MMTVHLPEDLETSIRAEVDRGRFASVDEAVAEAVRTLLRQSPPDVAEPAANGHAGPPEGRKSISEEVLEIFAEIPDEEFDKLPVDSSAQLDHYIYGTPKRPIP